MTVPTTSWSETTPAGGDDISQGDNRIRELKTQVREVVDVDHKMDSSGQDADMGKHNKVSFIEAADIGSGAEGLPILGAQTITGKAELVFTDEDDNDIQITKSGSIYPSQSTTLADWSAVLELIYPVGFVITLGVSTNPGTLLGVGTWTAIKGTVIVGIADAGTFGILDATSGAEEVTLTAAQSGLPAHTHTYDQPVLSDGGGSGEQEVQGIDADTATSGVVGGAASAAEAHTNLQPYIVKYIWQRTS